MYLTQLSSPHLPCIHRCNCLATRGLSINLSICAAEQAVRTVWMTKLCPGQPVIKAVKVHGRLDRCGLAFKTSVPTYLL